MPDKPTALRNDLEVGIYGTHAADLSASKLKLPAGGMRSEVVHAMVRDEFFLDGSARKNLVKFCPPFLNFPAQAPAGSATVDEVFKRQEP